MRKSLGFGLAAGFLAFTFMTTAANAACLRWETVCHYDCIEYYPNGTDCKKTKKRCERVCAEDSFDVDRGGVDDANRRFKPQSTGAVSNKTIAEPDVVITGRLEKATVEGKGVWVIVPRGASGVKAASYKVYEVDPGKIPIKAFENKLVDVAGTLSWTTNDKEGYLVKLLATSIRASASRASP